MKTLQFGAGILLLAAAQLTAVTISPLPYGINVHLAQNETLAKVKAAGITWIRIDVNWSVIEASKGKAVYTDVDRVVNYAAANGLSVYASIGSTPGWANGKKGSTYPAGNVADWKNFVARTVARYKNQVKYWGIWNEPNLKNFFALGKDKFVQQILLPAAQTIRGADPAAFIVGPELSHKTEAGTEWYFWMKYILDNAGSYFDIISHHIYEDHGVYYMYELLEQGDQFIPAVKTDRRGCGTGRQAFLDHGDRLEHGQILGNHAGRPLPGHAAHPGPQELPAKSVSFMRSSTIPKRAPSASCAATWKPSRPTMPTGTISPASSRPGQPRRRQGQQKMLRRADAGQRPRRGPEPGPAKIVPIPGLPARLFGQRPKNRGHLLRPE